MFTLQPLVPKFPNYMLETQVSNIDKFQKLLFFFVFLFFFCSKVFFTQIFIMFWLNILTDFNYATLTSPYIFQKTVECKLPLLR